MQFRIAGDRTAAHAPAGERYATRYIMQYDKDGNKVLVENGKTDLQEIIQKDLESTKLQNIIARCVDPTELKMLQTSVVDISKMPKTLMEAQNLMLAARADFDALPLEVKRYYGGSSDRYIADMSGKQAIWQKAMTELYPQPKQTAAETKGEAE